MRRLTGLFLVLLPAAAFSAPSGKTWEVPRQKALALAGDDAALKTAIEKLFANPQPAVLSNFPYAAGKRAKEFAEVLACFLEDERPEMRRATADVFRILKEKSMAPRVAKLLKDRDVEVRRAALSALQVLDDKSFAPEVLKLFKDPAGRVVTKLGRSS